MAGFLLDVPAIHSTALAKLPTSAGPGDKKGFATNKWVILEVIEKKPQISGAHLEDEGRTLLLSDRAIFLQL
jgi:hypothetical protein